MTSIELSLKLMIPLLISSHCWQSFPRAFRRFGNFAMAVLVGVGAAAAVGGALIGTLLPQAQAAMNAFDLSSSGGNPNAFLDCLKAV